MRLTEGEVRIGEEKNTAGRRMDGLGLTGVFWLFMAGGFLGFLIETVFCLVTTGEWMNRSTVVFGPFSTVWALGAVLLTAVLNRQLKAGAGNTALFLTGALLGGAYEYAYSWVQEQWYGAVFWDYSGIPLNLDGRINFLFCVFWGVIGVIWIRFVYPVFRSLMVRASWLRGKTLTAAVMALMVCNIAVSSLVIVRMGERQRNTEARNEAESYLDEYFPDDRVRRMYPDMAFVR